MMDSTGCDYVMIGRGAASNPFLFRQINEYLKTGKYSKSTSDDKISAVAVHTVCKRIRDRTCTNKDQNNEAYSWNAQCLF